MDSAALANELWVAILEFMEPGDLLQVMLCSRRMLDLARHDW